MHAFFHWFNIEYWTPSWPNVFAPSFWTLLGIGISHARIVRLHNKHHDEIMGRKQ